jgi:hypothetical protein
MKKKFSAIDPSWTVKETIDEPDGIHPEDEGADKICWREYSDESGRVRRVERCVFKNQEMSITFEGEYIYHDGYATYRYRDIFDEEIEEENIDLDSEGNLPQVEDFFDETLAITARYSVDQSWRREEKIWIPDDNHGKKIRDVNFFDGNGKLRRSEQWLIYTDGRPDDLIFERIEEERDGKTWFWYNSVGLSKSGFVEDEEN